MNRDTDIYFQGQLVHEFDCWSSINHFGVNVLKSAI